jgi:hypothetical protein
VIRRLATVAAATAVTVATLAVPAGAEPSSVSTVVSTAAANGLARVDATCHFGPVVPDNVEDQMVVTGVATAPGADTVSVRCWWEMTSGDDVLFDRTYAGFAAAVVESRNGWRGIARVCVSATGYFPSAVGPVLLDAPRVCA